MANERLTREEVETYIQEAISLAASAPTIKDAVKCVHLVATIASALLKVSGLPSKRGQVQP